MRRRLLLITQFAPAADAHHGSVRVVHGLLSALAERHDVVLLHLAEGGDMDPALAARCADVQLLQPPALGRWPRRAVSAAALARGRTAWAGVSAVGRVRRRVAWLAERWQPHIVQVEHGMLGETLAGARPGQLRIVTIYDPASSRREYLGFHSEGIPLAQRVDAWAGIRQERRVLRLADAAVVFTEHDRRLLAKQAPPETTVVTIPLGADVPSEPTNGPEAQPPIVLFVGSYRHPPNTDAAMRLVRNIMPRVWAVHPEVTVELVGELPPPEIGALDGPGVRVAGSVPSVAPHLARAAVVAAPVRLGGGMRVKVVEALAAGKAVVTTSLGAQGLAARHGHQLLIADGDQQFAEAISSLLDDEAGRRRLGSQAHEWAARELSWSAMADRYDELYERLARRAR